MAAMSWNNDLVLEFLELYKKEQVLWDPKHPAHRNRTEVSDAWVRIQLSLGIHFSIIDLKKKKESLMTSFRMHLNKKKSQEGYHTTWFAYPLMESFLGGKYECDSTMDHEFFTATYNTSQTEQNNVGERSNAAGRQNKPTSQQQTRPIKSSPRSPEKATDLKSFFVNNTAEKREMDEYDLYGQLLAKKLRKLDEHQRDVTMHEIDNLMFRAKMQGSSQRSYSSSPSPVPRKVKSPLFIVAPPGHAHYEDENIPYQDHIQPPEPS